MGPALYERVAKPSPSSQQGSTTALVLSAPPLAGEVTAIGLVLYGDDSEGLHIASYAS